MLKAGCEKCEPIPLQQPEGTFKPSTTLKRKTQNVHS
jgi:hypothetical protein